MATKEMLSPSSVKLCSHVTSVFVFTFASNVKNGISDCALTYNLHFQERNDKDQRKTPTLRVNGTQASNIN